MNEFSKEDRFVIGVDFGTLSGRALLVRVSDGQEIASSVYEYPNGILEHSFPMFEKPLPPDWCLQVPEDYVRVLKNVVPDVLRKSRVDKERIVGIATDFTASTVMPVNESGRPLCELPEFTNNPHAYVKLWKHHAAQPHADRINALARKRNEKWLARYGGKISAEWQFAKGLQLLEEAPEVYSEMRYWVEAADWIIWQLCGNFVPNICTAGFKGIFQDGQYPSKEFLAELNPKFENFANEKLCSAIGQLGSSAGRLTAEAASWTGLLEGTVVAVGNVDAHVTSAAANAIRPGQMVAIMGTSTCHVMVSDILREVPGMCGVVRGGIVPNALAYEAGQSGVGDIFGWFVENFVPASYSQKAQEQGLNLHEYLSSLTAKDEVGQHGLVALDWENGNRSTLVDHQLSGLILGMTLATKPEEIYRALVESTAFGAKKIVETFKEAGVFVSEFIAAGGLIKNEFVMQIYADVLNLPISLIRSEQGPALGSAIHAAVAAGMFEDIYGAAEAMGGVSDIKYSPNQNNLAGYENLYLHYDRLYQEFGHNETMHSLRKIRDLAIQKGGSDS